VVFSSLLFLFVFLPICLVCYYAFPGRNLRNVILAAFSLIFYAWGEPIWVSLLLITAIVDYANGRFIDFNRGQPIAKIGLYCSLLVNLGLLATFKYSDFIVENVNLIGGFDFQKPGFLLPVGISFYTFQTVSYTLDVYRGEVRAQKSFLNFLLFVSSFHQLCAGPIVRYGHVAREIEEREFNAAQFSEGVTKFCKGLFKKVFFANVAGSIGTSFLEIQPEQMSHAGAWFGLLMYTLQIYFDFSGYSDMAIGLGRMFGFHYNENFNHPYAATSLTDFWRRWHISMGQFFRDYIYIPLGGNRNNSTRNIFIVWCLTGLWHGASWNFVVWGLYFGTLLYIEKQFLLKRLEVAPALLRHSYALFFILIGWAIFYFTDFHRLFQFLKVLFFVGEHDLIGYDVSATMTENIFWLAAALLLCLPVAPWIHASIERMLGKSSRQVLQLACSVIFLGVSVILLVGQSYNPFIYFRF